MNATGSTALAMENAALRAENEKLREAGVTMSRAADRFFDSAKEQQARAEAAEVENERLRAALRDVHAAARDNYLIANITRAALEE